ncbi:Rho-GAP domain-containing protein [Trichostrongylus colubriformis]|uniref:Rho-GAP domain-containing protein n=1 Tax=Trichostrongylus colubriformis TaxID=6319 RepID=A0AAN8IWY0_TRICO
MLSPSSPDSSEDSFLLSGHRRPPGTSSSARRDRSVPPQLVDADYDYTPPQERARRERGSYDAYLYPASPANMNRNAAQPRLSRRALQQAATMAATYDEGVSPYYNKSGGYSSPAYSSPYSTRSYQSPPVPARNLVIQSDGYFMHDVSPDTSLSRLRPPSSESPSTSSGVPQLRVDTHAIKSEGSSLDNTDEEQSSGTTTMNHNRRDSGVGSSLSRSPSGPSSQRLRQSILPYSINSYSFPMNASHVGSLQSKRRAAERSLMSSSILSSCSSDDAFFTDVQLARCVDSLSVLELARLSKLAYLRVTAILEKHMGPGSTVKIGDSSPTQNGAAKNWTVQKFFKKIKQMDGKTGKEIEVVAVFGQPLAAIQRRSGLCLPRTILEVLRYLRQMSADTVGIFRKNGVKSRILEIRTLCDRDADVDVFVDENRLDPGQVHDVADMLKQYLRELPEPLMTARLSETFANIFIHVPENERMLALQYAILLLPDENREALQTLLLFLSDVSKHAETNSMPAQNLAVCFTPSLFQLSASRLDKITPTRRHKTIGAAGMPTEREMRETKAAQQCLTFLIQHCRNVFVTAETCPEERIQSDNDAPLLKELGLNGPRAYLIDKVLDLVKEHSERWKGWIFDGTHEEVEISCKIPNDCHPLKLFRVWIDVPAPPKQVMNRIMRERNVWDASVVNWRIIDVLHVPDTDLHHFHRADLSEIRGACAIAERSVQCNETQLLGGISAAVLDNRFLIEPKAGHSRVTYLSRVDLRGRGPCWYNKVYGNMIARQMIRLRDSFQSSSESIVGPETKV